MQKLWRKILAHFIPHPENTFRPHLLRKSWLIFFLTIVLTAEGVFVAALIAKESVLSLPAAVVPAEIIAFTNVERRERNANSLYENPLLSAAAAAKAKDMAEKGYFAHVGPGDKQPWRWIEEAEYEYSYAGENLAVRFTESTEVVKAWMESPTHKDNILKPVYTEIGVGTAEGFYEGMPATFVVQYFATPKRTVAISSEQAQVEPPLESESARVAGASVAQVSAPTLPPQEMPQQEQESPSAPTPQNAAQMIQTSQYSATWIIGAVLLALVLLLALAFFIHIEIQSHEMLIGGGLVAATAFLFLMLNVQLPNMYQDAFEQSASVANIGARALVDDRATSTSADTPPETEVGE